MTSWSFCRKFSSRLKEASPPVPRPSARARLAPDGCVWHIVARPKMPEQYNEILCDPGGALFASCRLAGDDLLRGAAYDEGRGLPLPTFLQSLSGRHRAMTCHRASGTSRLAIASREWALTPRGTNLTPAGEFGVVPVSAGHGEVDQLFASPSPPSLENVRSFE